MKQNDLVVVIYRITNRTTEDIQVYTVNGLNARNIDEVNRLVAGHLHFDESEFEISAVTAHYPSGHSL